MPRPSTRLLVLFAATSLLAACSEPGRAVPSTSTTSTSAREDETYGAPRVSDPIDPREFRKSPCAVLTEAQSTGLGWEREGSASSLDSKDPYCDWDSKDGRENYVFGWLASNARGLADTYRANATIADFAAYWEPTTVSGYPGVFEDGTDDRADGFCNLVVGIRDDLTFRVGASGGSGGEACSKIKNMAELAIKTMRGA
ncbi:DUF3558 domain-containing protein [Actinokineospora sp. NBRC 105648]|uniref:DUF3558 domain-containing protein n=1 Tax=Actinokineospora sp. NBRC 105648 TaxID=3032206 RepID=UPI0024A3DB11|nr:DUF3558 domain-containing protein [Actinokineospora sp. NBRC 105648]GLZ40404.1 hypothetical protein Acsp05_40280 [Actinokineospora sp. NBRC 105648]